MNRNDQGYKIACQMFETLAKRASIEDGPRINDKNFASGLGHRWKYTLPGLEYIEHLFELIERYCCENDFPVLSALVVRSLGDLDISFPGEWFDKNIAEISKGEIPKWKLPLTEPQKEWHRRYWQHLHEEWKTIDYEIESKNFREWLNFVDWFEWPSTVAPTGLGEMEDIPMHRKGLFAYLGYHVGQNGNPDGERLEILDKIFSNKLPHINSDEYMAEFSQPESPMRLKKMAHFLAAQARNYSRNQYSDYSTAISHYKLDLDYLYEKYYVGYFGFDDGSAFPWPDCPTPEPKTGSIPTSVRKPKVYQPMSNIKPPVDNTLPNTPSAVADTSKARKLEGEKVDAINHITKSQDDVGGGVKHIARPYARAVFELAEQQDALTDWSDQLNLLAVIAADADVIRLANDPRVSAEQLQTLILEVATDRLVGNLSEQVVNLVKLLVRNRRIGALPDIARVYATLRAEAERVIEAQMITAAEINPQQREQFTSALQSKLGRKVKLEFGVDQELVGGAVVRAGDWVIDGSVRAQLEQLVGALRA